MEMQTLATLMTCLTGILGVVGWFNKKIKEEVVATRALTDAKLRSLGRSIDETKKDIERISEELIRHDRKISQTDIVMVHVDDTMKQLAGTVAKLDETLNALRISFAEIRNKE